MRVAWVSVFAAAACASMPSYELDDERAPCPSLGAVCDAPIGPAPAITAATAVAPSAMMPPEVISQLAHNNLDVTWFRGRMFFAFRTAPYHFASPDVVMYVVSTEDHEHWTFEAAFDLDTDLREPRFLAVGDRLFLYFAVLGDYLPEFTPREARVAEYLGPAEWSASQIVLDPGFIPWRTKSIAGQPSVIGYVGGENIYQPDGEPVRVSWWVTNDGRTLAPKFADQPVVLEGGSSETDAVVLDDGSLVAVSRNELGDDLGWGSKLCRAAAGALGDWTCVGDPRKYDSPLMFRHRDEVYLIARRQVSDTGNYDLGLRDLPASEQTSQYNLNYWVTPKRCALWRVDPSGPSVAHVLDLPSSGDTCFPGLVELGDGRYLVYDYTSPLDGDLDRRWMDAQFGPTEIHYVTLTLP